jgi:hypothetical protein
MRAKVIISVKRASDMTQVKVDRERAASHLRLAFSRDTSIARRGRRACLRGATGSRCRATEVRRNHSEFVCGFLTLLKESANQGFRMSLLIKAGLHVACVQGTCR